ncbi:MAG: tetratricopeptide repeat protein [Bacteroidota bacterium]
MKTIVSTLLLSCFLFTAALSAQSADAGVQFQKANAYFQDNEFDKAIETYEALAAEGYQSAELYYNLGNSYYRTDRLGKAILYYEKALTLDGSDADIRYNLKVARDNTKNEISPIPAFILLRWWWGVRQLAGSSFWAALGLLLFWLGVGGLIYWLMASDRQQKKRGFVAGLSLLLVSALPFALAYSRLSVEQNSRMAIVQREVTSLRSAPDAASTEIKEVYEGLKVELLDQIGDWSKVRLMDGEQGWLPMEVYERI